MSHPHNANRKLVSGHQWGVQLQREIDVLVAATQGQGVSALMLALATEAVIADNGTLTDSGGEPGYAWNPEVYQSKAQDWITSRIRAAGASIGRVLAGGHPSHRAYLAILEAVYVVTTQQSYDIAERIEKLWDEAAAMQDAVAEERIQARRPGLLRRLWDRLAGWWHASYEPGEEEA